MQFYVNIFITVSTVFAPVLVLLKYVHRKKFPATVTCWFCGEKTRVPRENTNCWDCPSCDQYNGFDKDGNYNKPIPSQYDERLNPPTTGQKDEFLGGNSVFCERCSQNQLLKVKQLANFVPYNEKNFEQEVDAFKKHLEKVYRLCLPCEIKVQQELEIQNEAISKRLSHIDHFRSFMQPSVEEPTFLHSSYTDRSFNKLIITSVVLHTVALVCSILLALKDVSLTGQGSWQKTLLFVHPALLWMDRHGDAIVCAGLVTGLVAKLCLGKYRLHIVDAISCPVWLLVFLSQTGFLPVKETGYAFNTCSLVLNIITCAVCLGINRRRRNQSNTSLIRTSLDSSVLSDSVSSVSPFSSVSQVVTRSVPDEQSSERSRSQRQYDENIMFFGSSKFSSKDSVASRTRSHDHTTSRSESQFKGQSSRSADSDYQDSSRSQVTSTTNPQDDSKTQISAKQGQGHIGQEEGKKKDVDNGDIADTTTELNAVSLGEPSLKRSDSGIFSTVSQCGLSQVSNLGGQTVSQNLHARKLSQGRPLISPAAFKHSSTPENHRPSSLPKYGLFSVPSTASPITLSDGPDRPASPFRASAFSSPSLYSTQRHSFTPERPSSPVITSFGESPFKNVPLNADRHSQFSTVTRSTSSFAFTPEEDGLFRRKSSFVVKQDAPVANKRLSVPELSDEESDDSDITSVSRRFGKTDRRLKQTEEVKVSWWRHPGVIGFFLGGSVVANIMLVMQNWFSSGNT